MRIVENWKQFRRWYSLHSMVIVAALLGAWAALPDKLQDAFSPLELKIGGIVVLVLGIAGRFVQQHPPAHHVPPPGGS